MLELLKKYYVFMLILMVFSYLVPKESYKKYIQLFIGIFMVVMFLKPVLMLFTMENPNAIYEVFEPFNQKIESIDLEQLEGETIYEYFFSSRVFAKQQLRQSLLIKAFCELEDDAISKFLDKIISIYFILGNII